MVAEFKGATRGNVIDATKARARLPGLEIEIVSAVYRHWRLCRPCQAFHARRGCASRAGDQGLSIRGRGQPLLVSPPPQIAVAVSPDAKGVEAGEGRRAP
jgi:hypothetical protein